MQNDDSDLEKKRQWKKSVLIGVANNQKSIRQNKKKMWNKIPVKCDYWLQIVEKKWEKVERKNIPCKINVMS